MFAGRLLDRVNTLLLFISSWDRLSF